MNESPIPRHKTFFVRSVWDEEAGVFHCDSDIVGLHIEARTLSEFEVLMNEFAPDMIVANHIDPGGYGIRLTRELVPIW